MLRVIIAAPGPAEGLAKGGVARQAQYLYQAAQEYGPPEVQFRWLRTHSGNRLWPLQFALSYLRLFGLLLCGKCDLLYTPLASKGSFWRKYLLFRLARCFGVQQLIHLHGGGFEDFYAESAAPTQARIRHFFTEAKAVIILGRIWQPFVTRLGVPESQIHCIPNAVPTPDLPRKSDSSTPHLLFVGQLVARKGVGELIEALATLKSLDWQATLAGNGDVSHYQQQAAACGLADRIAFPGWLDDASVQALYQQGDALVLPSHIENQPLCLLEAMAHGLPVIATNVGTIPEILHPEFGLIVPVNDPPALAQAIEKLLKNPNQRQTMAKAAREAHLQQYSLQPHLTAVMKILD